jgi:ABC-type bacteriocin/lantibiotic exporter with double-glycine peptidase domain
MGIARKLASGTSMRTRGFFTGCPLLVIVTLIVVSSCAKTRVTGQRGTSRVIESVPFYPQQEYQCGPASLAGVLNYWEVTVSPDEIAKAIYSRSARGTLDLDMVLYAEGKGVKADHYAGSLQDIRKNIDAELPLVVMVDYGLWLYQQNHFMVVVGYDEKGVIANSGKNRLQFIPRRNFLRSWEKTKFWTLRITPED